MNKEQLSLLIKYINIKAELATRSSGLMRMYELQDQAVDTLKKLEESVE